MGDGGQIAGWQAAVGGEGEGAAAGWTRLRRQGCRHLRIPIRGFTSEDSHPWMQIASEEDIRKAYRRAALKHHPDKVPPLLLLPLLPPLVWAVAGVVGSDGLLLGWACHCQLSCQLSC